MNKQTKEWKEDLGKGYIKRNARTVRELNDAYIKEVGVSKSEINNTFLKGLSVDRTLEVGCNVGLQLILLYDELGYERLYGIDVNTHALSSSKKVIGDRRIRLSEGSAQDIPFNDRTFGLVMTNAVLIHIPPGEINQVMDEIYRCSNKYIFGYEYYSSRYVSVTYQDSNERLWKTDFMERYLNRFSDLEVVKAKRYECVADKKLINQAYLLEKVKK